MTALNPRPFPLDHLALRGAPAAEALVVGEERPVITMRGQQFTGHGKNVLGDPRVALTWLANELSGLSITLRKDQVITTGTCMVPLAIGAGDSVVADFGIFGRVSISFTAH